MSLIVTGDAEQMVRGQDWPRGRGGAEVHFSHPALRAFWKVAFHLSLEQTLIVYRRNGDYKF